MKGEGGCPQRSSSEARAKWGTIYMYHVYIIRSEIDFRYYYGFTEQDPKNRLAEHNEGKSSYTKKYKPWKLVWFGSFESEQQAKNFETYLKTPSGYAFSRKRLI